MNIEEERKAFVEALKSKLIADFGCGCLAEGHNKDTFDHPGVQFTFEGWLAAKEHAAEVVKPGVIVSENIGGRFGVYHPDGLRSIVTSFAFKVDAEAWAISNGYRVIE